MGNNPHALTLTHALDLDDAREAARALARARIDTRKELEELNEDAAEKKRAYRKAKAIAYVSAEGTDAGMRKADAEKRASDAEFEMEMAERMVKVKHEKLEEIDGERASLHRLMEWSMKLDPLAERQPKEYAPPIGAARVLR